MREPCMCGAIDCFYCGELQGYSWCFEHRQSAQYCCRKETVMKIPEVELLEAIEENALSLTNWGFCLSCGEQQDGCEPDARNYLCESCEESMVFGAEEILIMGEYE